MIDKKLVAAFPYVYGNCDYFIYLDAKNNTYSMFSGSSSGTPLPPVQCDDYERQMILLSRTDITQDYMEDLQNWRELETALRRAQTDTLTGLWNYQGTVDNIGEQLKNGQGLYAFLFIDLDNFKGINDNLGHAAGDRFLRQVADVLSSNVRRGDVAGRVGGDEFIFFADGLKTKEEANQLAERLCQGMNRIHLRQCDGLDLSCSIGMTVSQDRDMNYGTLLKKADAMVYRAKMNGKNQFFAE